MADRITSPFGAFGLGGLYQEGYSGAGGWPWALDPEGADTLQAITKATVGLG